MAKQDRPGTIGLHIRISEALHTKILTVLARLRKKDSMANLSDAVRELIERGLKEKT